MNNLLAVAPAFHADAFELRFLLDRLGPYVGRYALRLPRSWERDFHAHCDTLSPIEGRRCKELFLKSKAAFIAGEMPWKPNQSWVRNIERLIEEGTRFDGVIADPKDCDRFRTLRDFDWDSLPDPKDCQVLCSPEEFASAASILLRNSPRVVLVDPYFRPNEKECLSVLRQFCKVAERSRLAQLDMIVRESILCKKETLDTVVHDAKRALQDIIAPSGGIWLVPVDDSMSADRMHERYLISEIGGLEFGYGFRAHYDGTKSRISVVGKEVHQKLLALFYDGDHRFHLAQGVTPTGIRVR